MEGNMEINIEKENPLITILKNGKIPVVRISNEGFKNYNQEQYKNSRLEASKVTNFPTEGCFVHIGGIQGTYVSGNHFGEAINIGYIEPEEEVFKTYPCSYKRKKRFCYEKARKRFNDVKYGYYEYLKENECKNSEFLRGMALEDFDLLTEAIVDASKVTPVLKLSNTDTRILKYCNQDYLRLFCVEPVFYNCMKQLDKKLLNHFGTTELTESEINLINDNSLYRCLWLEEFHHYSVNKSFKYSSSYVISFKNKLIAFQNYIEELKQKYKAIYLELSVRENLNCLFISLDSYIGSYVGLKFEYFNEDIIFEKIQKNSKYYDELLRNMASKDYSTCKSPKFISSKVQKEDLYNDNLKPLFYIVADIYDEYTELFREYYDIKKSPMLELLNKLRILEEALKDYSYKLIPEDGGKILVQTNNFSLEYSLVLRDGILIIENSEKVFYNLDDLTICDIKVRKEIEDLVNIITKNYPQT